MFPNPELFGITISWYDLFHRTAVLTAFLFFIGWYRYKKPFKLSIWKAMLLILFLVIVCYTGSRIFAALAYLSEGGTWNELVQLVQTKNVGGYRWYGALITLVLAIPIFIKVFSFVKFARIFDVLGLTFCLFTVIVKQACLFSGDGCYGVITTLPWGMYFPYGAAPNILPVHPTPLYDSLFHLMLFAFLVYYIRKAKFNGEVGLIYLLTTAVFGFSLEFIRTNPEVLFGLNFSQYSYLLLLICSIILYKFFKKSQKYTDSQKRQLNVSRTHS